MSPAAAALKGAAVREGQLKSDSTNEIKRARAAEASVEALYASAYTDELVFGLLSQQVSGAAQLVTNTKGGVSTEVGMPMAPSIWLINFALLYMLSPDVAANMPAAWAPIPSEVADAILASPTGQVPYCEHAEALGGEPVPCPAPAPVLPSSTTTAAAAAPVAVGPRFTG